jgi:hypothetical protein
MTDLSSVTRYLGIQFQRTHHGLLLHQHDFAMSILLLAQMLDFRPTFVPMAEGTVLRRSMNAPTVNAQLYRQLVGKLLYLTRTRPNLAFSVGVASRYMQVPKESHLELVRSILRYLRRYPSIGLYFAAGEDNHLQSSSDADYAQDADDRISVGAYLFTLGPTPISWSSKKQTTTARSSCESEYRALSNCTSEAIWLRRLMSEIGFGSSVPTILKCDNQSAIRIARNPVFHDRTKHFQVDWHFSRQ